MGGRLELEKLRSIWNKFLRRPLWRLARVAFEFCSNGTDPCERRHRVCGHLLRRLHCVSQARSIGILPGVSGPEVLDGISDILLSNRRGNDRWLRYRIACRGSAAAHPSSLSVFVWGFSCRVGMQSLSRALNSRAPMAQQFHHQSFLHLQRWRRTPQERSMAVPTKNRRPSSDRISQSLVSSWL